MDIKLEESNDMTAIGIALRVLKLYEYDALGGISRAASTRYHIAAIVALEAEQDLQKNLSKPPEENKPMAGIKLEEMPQDTKTIRRYLNMRQHFVEISKLPEVAYERDDRLFYKNKFVSAMWSIFKAGYRAAAITLKANGHMDMNYHVVGRITYDGHTFADKPRKHTHFGQAVTEMRRLGAKHPNTKFGVFTLVSTYMKEEK